MIRVVDSILVGVAAAVAIWTYQVKHEAELSAKKIKSLKAQIAAQDRKIILLEADWAIETSPPRLERLSARFEKQLELRPLDSTQIVDADELPELREAPTSEEGETYARENDGTVTGGIGELIEKAGDD